MTWLWKLQLYRNTCSQHVRFGNDTVCSEWPSAPRWPFWSHWFSSHLIHGRPSIVSPTGLLRFFSVVGRGRVCDLHVYCAVKRLEATRIVLSKTIFKRDSWSDKVSILRNCSECPVFVHFGFHLTALVWLFWVTTWIVALYRKNDQHSHHTAVVCQ